jgi:hypothetical protein
VRTSFAGSLSQRLNLQRGQAFGTIIICALVAFEIFNYSTTDFALHDLLGDLKFIGIRWSTILSIAFCGIDFAGIARIFTPEQGTKEPVEVWYLLGAWLLAATMNAMLTWWGISIAILGNHTLGSAVVERETMLQVVPMFVATLVWLSRILLIGTFSVTGDKLFRPDASNMSTPNRNRNPGRSTTTRRKQTPQPVTFQTARQRNLSNAQEEPVYEPLYRGNQEQASYQPVTTKSRNE